MMNFKLFLLIGILFCTPFYSSAQFEFGLKGGLKLSQVEGDNLVGFKKVGYELGLTGGYSVSKNNNIVIDLSFARIGSNRTSENVSRNSNRYLIETDFKIASVFLGHRFRFGDNWNGERNYRFTSGFLSQKIFMSEVSLFNKDGFSTTIDEHNRNFYSLRFGPGFYVNSRFSIDLFYEHALSNIVKNYEDISYQQLKPFSLSIIASYYL